MGKASKWIRNLLIGKKEEKNKKKLDSCVCEEKRLVIIQTESTPKVKRRWSFGKSGAGINSSSTSHKSTRSFDSIVTKGVVLGFENELIAKAATNTGPLQAAAATIIQAFFRSYLARKALCALRGLVKLQAVVRGHLVRKQTTSMLRCMNALMAIQVRARLHRIQESHLLTKRRSTSHGGGDLLLQDVHPLVPLPLYTTTQQQQQQAHEMKVVNEPISGHTHNTETQERIMEHRYHHSRKREDDSVSSLSSRTYGSGSRAFEEEKHHSINIAVSQRRYSTPSSQEYYYDTTPTSHQFVQPSYMANTESSRAKVRSQSEPKQRPLDKQKCRTKTASPSNAHHPWLIKLYRSTKSSKEIHSHSTTNINSSYCKTLIAYEPAVNLYQLPNHERSSFFGIKSNRAS